MNYTAEVRSNGEHVTTITVWAETLSRAYYKASDEIEAEYDFSSYALTVKPI